MVRVAFGVVLGAAAMAANNGCATTKRPVSVVADTKVSHLLFNPERTKDTAPKTDRADWPATLAYEGSPEILVFGERIIDRQAYWPGSHDHYDRRFYSVRVGSGRR